VCGILGPCTAGLAAIAGLILGIVALSRIGKSAGQLRGRGLAVAGIVLAAITLLVLVLLIMMIPILVPAVMGALREAQGVASMNNMKQLCIAATVYADVHDGNLPPPDSWPEVLRDCGVTDTVVADLSDPGRNRMFAMNVRLQGKRIDEIRHHARTVLFFECAPGAPPGGGPELLPVKPRFRGGYIAGFVDCHVERVAPQETDKLIWDPD